MARHARRPRPSGPVLAAAVCGVASLAVGLTGAAADDMQLLLLAVVLGQLVVALAVWAAAGAVAAAVAAHATARHLVTSPGPVPVDADEVPGADPPTGETLAVTPVPARLQPG